MKGTTGPKSKKKPTSGGPKTTAPLPVHKPVVKEVAQVEARPVVQVKPVPVNAPVQQVRPVKTVTTQAHPVQEIQQPALLVKPIATHADPVHKVPPTLQSPRKLGVTPVEQASARVQPQVVATDPPERPESVVALLKPATEPEPETLAKPEPKIDGPVKRTKFAGVRPKEALDKPADAAAVEVEKLIQTIKTEQSEAKKALETKLAEKLEQLKPLPLPADRLETAEEQQVRADRERRRGLAIMQHGVNLTKLGLNADTLKADPRFKALLKTHKLVLSDDTIALGTTDIFHLRSGAAAFDLVPIQQPNGPVLREVYRKLGKADGKNNEYIKDDQGVLTRRYAYVEKSKYQFRELLGNGEIKGRYSKEPSAKTERPYNTFDPQLRDRVNGLPGGTGNTFTDPYQLAYVHQELGSGAEQRGVSATSSAKHAIFSNQGDSFKTDDGVRFEIDLARMPKGQPGAPQIVNHYARDARIHMDGANLAIKGERPRDFEHYVKSVIKNREIFLKSIRAEYVSAVTLHGVGTLRPPAEGFTLASLRSLIGPAGGYKTYAVGFADGVKRLQNVNPDPVYQEARRDAVEYNTGFAEGATARTEVRQRRRNMTAEELDFALGNAVGFNKGRNKKDLEKERFKQGFWDAYWGRGARTV